jgi:hypothetical protein
MLKNKKIDKSGGNDMSVNNKGKESAREKNLRKTP